MRNTLRAGFTLVEILIVVVILGILAAIVVPQFTNASQEAVKGALSSQLQTINSQVELYRVKNTGTAPTLASGEDNQGWGELVGGEYLKEIPINGYTRSGAIDTGTTADVDADNDPANGGWIYEEDLVTVFAVGFDGTNLSDDEDNFDVANLTPGDGGDDD